MTVFFPSQQSRVAAMFGRIAPGYDQANRILSFGADAFWRRRLVRDVKATFAPGSRCRILDLATGTCDVSLALARSVPGAEVLAVDFCLPMLRAGNAKIEKAGAYAKHRIAPIAGNALCLPFGDGCVDAVTVSFGLRNMEPRASALAEVFRVLASGGTFHVLEFGSAKGRIWGGLYNLYLTRILPFLGGLIAGDREAYRYLSRTIGNFPKADVLCRELLDAGFSSVSAARLWGGIVFLHTARK